VSALEVVGDLRRAESEESELDDAGDQREPVLLVSRVGTLRFHRSSAARAVAASDLDEEDRRLGWREVGDCAPADLERFAKTGAAIGASLERELHRRRVRNRAFASPPRVAALATRREWVLVDGAPMEHSTRRDVAGLGGPVGGGEHRASCLVPPKLLLESTVLFA
jgi:hypothetical protein